MVLLGNTFYDLWGKKRIKCLNKMAIDCQSQKYGAIFPLLIFTQSPKSCNPLKSRNLPADLKVLSLSPKAYLMRQFRKKPIACVYHAAHKNIQFNFNSRNLCQINSKTNVTSFPLQQKFLHPHYPKKNKNSFNLVL